MSAVACFKNKFTVVTLYTNLGTDGVAYGIQQVEAKLIITAQELLPNLTQVLRGFDNRVKHIVYFEHPFRDFSMDECSQTDEEDVNITSFSTIEDIGKLIEKDEFTTKQVKLL